MRKSPLLAALTLVLLLGCGNAEPISDGSIADPAYEPWRQRPLWSIAPAGVQSHYGTRGQRSIRALKQAPGTLLRFVFDLGDVPRFSFRPLVAPGGSCVFAVSVRLLKPGASGVVPAEQLYLKPHLPSGATLSVAVSVDLAEFAGKSVQLELEANGAGETGDSRCEPYWGSAMLIDRHFGVAVRGLAVEKPNVLFLTADTLRADALGTWGREPTPSPALDRFAGRSDVWMNAYSSINNTNPSFASLMTGLYVKNHRVFNLTTPLPKQHTTLAEILSEAGYATRAVVSAAHLGRSGLRQGFDDFTQPRGQFFAETVVDMGIEWLQEGGEAPFFLWLHFFDVHTPHTPPSPYIRGVRPTEPAGMEPVANWEKFRRGGIPKIIPGKPHPFSGNSKLYMSEVAYLDRQIDRLLSYLDSHGLTEHTIIVFVADHGETLGERQSFYRHSGLYEETTHVPLMIRWPGQRKGRRVEGLVQHFDVFPTVLHALGLPVPVQDGVDLRIGADGGGTREIVFANHANNRGEMARTDEHLLLVNRKIRNLRDGAHFYELGDDPKARKDLAAEQLPEQAELRKRLRSWLRDRRKLAAPVARKIGATERAQLKALGYLE